MIIIVMTDLTVYDGAKTSSDKSRLAVQVITPGTFPAAVTIRQVVMQAPISVYLLQSLY